MSELEPLKYAPISSFVDSSFFTKLADLKLDKFKLDTNVSHVGGYMTNPTGLNKFNTSPIINLDYSSFDDSDSRNDGNLQLKGTLRNVNTIEEFKNIDKQLLLRNAAQSIHDTLKSVGSIGETVVIPKLHEINPFILLSFSDLKKYKFYYWFAFPTLTSNWYIKSRTEISDEEANTKDKKQEDDDIFHQISKHEFVFVDTSLNALPSSQLKNYLYYLAVCGHTQISLIVKRPQLSSYKLELDLDKAFDTAVFPKALGWERTAAGKLGPKLASLGSLINPNQLAKQAVDLNLKLMKWRIAPEIDLEIIKQQRALLLGAGTLGSYVARALMGWGVRKITLVDNGRVSYSNPVRQPLYLFKDCFSNEGQGELKALRAASALREIFPGVDSNGIELEVPMIGHPVEDEDRSKSSFDILESLFDDHDVIFLLMDSRESRWLPTVLGLAKGKLVINAALGFDSYLVMRHGSLLNGQDYDKRLGCYYCNDVVAPDDSLSDRTLDQMCTVTRPGGALMASSLAVELFVSVMQNNQGKNAGHNAESVIGEAPHQIRGFLHNFQQTKLVSPSFQHCSACSMLVIDHYRQHGWEFIRNCLDNSKYLEEVSGLKKVQEYAEKGAEEMLRDLELSDEDEEWIG